MPLQRARSVLGYMPPITIAQLLKASSDDHANRLLDGLNPPTRAQVLRHLNSP
jgi:hypothetical protein